VPRLGLISAGEWYSVVPLPLPPLLASVAADRRLCVRVFSSTIRPSSIAVPRLCRLLFCEASDPKDMRDSSFRGVTRIGEVVPGKSNLCAWFTSSRSDTWRYSPSRFECARASRSVTCK